MADLDERLARLVRALDQERQERLHAQRQAGALKTQNAVLRQRLAAALAQDAAPPKDLRAST
jgi:hypothetical protein